MRRVLLLSVALGALALGGCAGVTSATIQADVAAIEAQVQADANLACGFIPTIATVAAFIPGVGIIAADAATIAQGICTAIAKAPVVVAPSLRARAVALGVDVNVGSVRTPNGLVAIVGHFTR